MRADLHATREQCAKLFPFQVGSPANFSRDDIEHAGVAVGLQDGESEVVRVIVAIVKRENDGVARQRATVVEGIEKLVEGDGVIALLLEVVQLFAKGGRGDRQADTQ